MRYFILSALLFLSVCAYNFPQTAPRVDALPRQAHGSALGRPFHVVSAILESPEDALSILLNSGGF